MQNKKCSSDTHQCPNEMDICCQFCTLNYSPCAGKCSGCWDQIQVPETLLDVQVETLTAQKLPTPVA